MSEARVRKALTKDQTDARNARRRKRAAEKNAAKKVAATSRKKKSRKKTKRATNLKGRKTRTDWNALIYGLQKAPKGKTLRRVCSSPGVAQVTRVRLLEAFEGIEAETKGSTLIVSRA